MVVEGVANHALQENQQTTPEAAFAGNGQLIASLRLSEIGPDIT